MAIVRKSLNDIRSARPRIDRARIAATTDSDIRRHMVEDGEDPGRTPGLRDSTTPKAVRIALDMTQREFAAALGVPLATLRNWEQGRTPPDPAARALLRIVAREPRRALKALAD